MLSTHTPSSIERRRTIHRRQNSTPAAFEAPTVRPLPTNNRQQRHQRSGLSLDLRGLNLMKVESFFPEDSTVSNTNTGQSQQQYMQVAQPHSQPQPGFQDPFMEPSVQQSLPSPRTPQRTFRTRSPSQPSQLPSPSEQPSAQELNRLHEHIQQVYGSCGQVFINILPTAAPPQQPSLLPTPSATPQKPSRLSYQETFDSTSLPPTFNGLPNINLEPTQSAMSFDIEHPEADGRYDSSSYYTSDAHSPSPLSSPRQKAMQPYLEGIQEEAVQEMAFPQAPAYYPPPMPLMPLSHAAVPHPALPADLQNEASIEYTGISPEEVQRYISEQDPMTNKWTCLYPDCAKMFGRRENIRSHVQTHLGDRQFRCNGCGKCFVRQHDLKRHAKIHSGSKDYMCPCGSGFARQDALTRHRQRGMCSGGFPDAVRRQAKRGRPKKSRPNVEERVAKYSRTRRVLASVSSSVSAGSPRSESYSAGNSPQPMENEYEEAVIPSYSPTFNDYSSSLTDQFSFETVSSPFESQENIKSEQYAEEGTFDGHLATFNVLQQVSQKNHTPPMSPNELRPQSSGSSSNALPTPQKESPPSRSSIQSNPFSTPPTSPADSKDVLEELFPAITDNGCSQFELEMNAMSDQLSPLDNSPYDFLDFTAAC